MWAISWAWQPAFDLKRHTLILCLCTSEGPASKLRKEGKSSASQHPSHYWSARIHGREPQWWENEATGQTAFWLHTASPDYLHWALMGHGWSGKGKTSNFNLGCMLIAKRLPVAWETSSLESAPSMISGSVSYPHMWLWVSLRLYALCWSVQKHFFQNTIIFQV